MKAFYHNPSAGLLNETDVIDFMDQYEEDDQLYKTEAGNAILIELTDKEIEELVKLHKEWK